MKFFLGVLHFETPIFRPGDRALSHDVTENQDDVLIMEEFPRRWSDDQLPQTGFQAWSPLAESSPIDYEEEDRFTPN